MTGWRRLEPPGLWLGHRPPRHDAGYRFQLDPFRRRYPRQQRWPPAYPPTKAATASVPCSWAARPWPRDRSAARGPARRAPAKTRCSLARTKVLNRFSTEPRPILSAAMPPMIAYYPARRRT